MSKQPESTNTFLGPTISIFCHQVCLVFEELPVIRVRPPPLPGPVRPMYARHTFDFHENALHFGLFRQRESDGASDRVSIRKDVLFVESFIHQFKVLYRRHVGGVFRVRSLFPTSPVPMFAAGKRWLTFPVVRLRPHSEVHLHRRLLERWIVRRRRRHIGCGSSATWVDTSQWSELYKTHFCKVL